MDVVGLSQGPDITLVCVCWGGGECCGVRQNQDVVSRRPIHGVGNGQVELVEL